jgi:hypothetical protein
LKVHIDYHVEVERHRYSVPHSLVGQMLEARITTDQSAPVAAGDWVSPDHAHVRGPGYYE